MTTTQPRSSVLHPSADVQSMRLADLIAQRTTWVQVVSMTALLTGVLLAITGESVVPYAPAFRDLPGWPWLYGAALAAAGASLLLSLAHGWHLLATVASLVATAVYAVLVYGFAALWVELMFDDVPYNALAPPYPVVVYLGMLALHLLHADVEGRAYRLSRVGKRQSLAARDAQTRAIDLLRLVRRRRGD